MGLGGRKRVRSHRDWKEGAAKGGGGGGAVRLAARGRNRCPSGGSTHPAVDAPRSPWPEVGGGTHVERARARPLTLLVDELRTAGPTRSIYGTRAWDWSVMWGRDGALKQLSSACGQWAYSERATKRHPIGWAVATGALSSFATIAAPAFIFVSERGEAWNPPRVTDANQQSCMEYVGTAR